MSRLALPGIRCCRRFCEQSRRCTPADFERLCVASMRPSRSPTRDRSGAINGRQEKMKNMH